ncbi:MAG: sulfotransferase, partial [Nocardioides sp.]
AWVRRYPEILDEDVSDPIVVVGMMRSGTTLAQRLLAADPRLRSVRGWEVLQVAPPLDLDLDDPAPDPRIAAGLTRQDQTQQFAPDLFAIHPMYALEAEEEIVFLADAFLSHVPESGAHVPTYRSWLNRQDFAPAYEHLRRMLQLLQWQQRRRETAHAPRRRWVLKTPAHLGYLDELRRCFPGLHLVHLHRDPRYTIPSGASLNTTLHRMHADSVDPHRIGAEWIERMGWTNDRALAIRAAWDAEPEAAPATDLAFEDLVRDPLATVARVYAALGLELDAPAATGMGEWLDRRPREAGRPPYAAASYGLTEAMIDERFADYNQRFRQY